MHLSLCQELKIYLPQALLTMLVMCWLIHCNFPFLFLSACVFPPSIPSKALLQKSVLLNPMTHQTKPLKAPADALV